MYDFRLERIEQTTDRPDRVNVYLRAVGDDYFSAGDLYVVRSVAADEAAWFQQQLGTFSLFSPNEIPVHLIGRTIQRAPERSTRAAITP